MVAVQNLDIDGSIGHPPREQAELARAGLVKPLHKHVPYVQNSDAGAFECLASRRTIGKQEMRNPSAVDHPSASAFDTDSGPAQCGAHFGKRPGPVFECNRYVLHQALSPFSIASSRSFRSMPQR